MLLIPVARDIFEDACIVECDVHMMLFVFVAIPDTCRGDVGALQELRAVVVRKVGRIDEEDEAGTGPELRRIGFEAANEAFVRRDGTLGEAAHGRAAASAELEGGQQVIPRILAEEMAAENPVMPRTVLVVDSSFE